jgi:hypothetical protein
MFIQYEDKHSIDTTILHTPLPLWEGLSTSYVLNDSFDCDISSYDEKISPIEESSKYSDDLSYDDISSDNTSDINFDYDNFTISSNESSDISSDSSSDMDMTLLYEMWQNSSSITRRKF